MSNTKINLALTFLAGIFIVLLAVLFFDSSHTATAPAQYGVVNTGNYDTVSQGYVYGTSSIGLAKTQLFLFGTASTTKLATVFNNTTSTLTCAPDDRGTTAASSSVVAGAAIIIGPNNGTVTPDQATFGQCQNGMTNCFPAYGSVDCVANATATVSWIKK